MINASMLTDPFINSLCKSVDEFILNITKVAQNDNSIKSKVRI